MVNLITERVDIWTAAEIPKTNGGRGRGKNGNGQSSYGIKKLRELILDLAVRGKLVPQDPNDEPASVLLEKIAKEKARLIKDGTIKKQKPLPEIGEDEAPYKIPESWEWIRLGKLGDWGAGATPNRKNLAYYGGNMPWLKSGELRDNEHLSNSEETVTNEALERCSLRVCQPGDVLIAMYGATIGMLAIPENIVTTNQAVCACTCHSGVFNHYLFLMLKAWRSEFAGQGAGGAQPNISKVKIVNTIAPLPPLAEQHRIVAKVDELMAICDQLEQQQTDSNATHQTLVETLLATLTHAADQRGFAEAWQRMANHFDTLFTTEQSIDHLKQTILQLAVMGKLVSQDPNDEPASILLEKTAKEKARLIKEGKIKKQKPLPEIGEDEKPFDLPKGWHFIRLIALSKIVTKGSSPKWQGVSYTKDPKDVLFITSENVGSYVLKLDHRKYVEKKFNEVEPRSILEKGDFLMNIVGASIGRTAIHDMDDLANINQAVCLIRVFSQFMDSQYLLHFFNSEICVSYMFDKQVDNARANLSMGNIAKFVIPFPPLAEQHRIVAKVDELMTLCETLKARLNDAQTTQVQLANAIVEKAVA